MKNNTILSNELMTELENMRTQGIRIEFDFRKKKLSFTSSVYVMEEKLMNELFDFLSEFDHKDRDHIFILVTLSEFRHYMEEHLDYKKYEHWELEVEVKTEKNEEKKYESINQYKDIVKDEFDDMFKDVNLDSEKLIGFRKLGFYNSQIFVYRMNDLINRYEEYSKTNKIHPILH